MTKYSNMTIVLFFNEMQLFFIWCWFKLCYIKCHIYLHFVL